MDLLLNMAAVVALGLVAVSSYRRLAAPDAAYWGLLALGVAGPLAWAWHLLAGDWNTALVVTLWVGIAASMAVFFVIALVDRQAWRLTRLLAPYLLVLAVLASLLPAAADQAIPDVALSAWVILHIVVSIIAVGLLTPAAVAALSSLLQSRALKSKRPSPLTRALPALADSDRLSERLLLASEAVLGLGVVSGLVTEYAQSGSFFTFSHKVLFSLIAFVIIGLLVVGRRVCGVRGQMAARAALLAYLLIIIGYFGMKFVHQVLLG